MFKSFLIEENEEHLCVLFNVQDLKCIDCRIHTMYITMTTDANLKQTIFGQLKLSV